MKRYLMFLAVMLNAVWASAQYSGSGNGTESDPYLIYNETQLYQMSNYLNQDGVVFKLMKDLDLTEFISENFPSEGWTPVGVETSHFKGKFYGNNHTVSGLFINKPSINNVGFFGYVEGATIQDLKLKGSSIRGGISTGSICGHAINSTISNCNVVLTSFLEGKTYTGGFVGFIGSSTIKECSSEATIALMGASSCGGFCGYSESSAFRNCTFEGNVSGGTDKLGGFVGEIEATDFTNCSSNGNTTGETNIGGFVGFVSTTCQLNKCSSIGNISGMTSVAGLAGTLNAGSSVSFSSCHHKGTITNAGERTGGIVATSNGVGINDMQNCSHFGDIIGTKHVGGLIGVILNSDNKPALHRYSLSYSSSDENYNAYTETVTEAISIDGSMSVKSINNCTSIGNLLGTSFVGGLIGEDIPSYSYQVTQKKLTNSSSYRYLFKDGVYQGTAPYNNSSGCYVNYYDYTRSYTSLSLINSYFSGTIDGTEYIGGIAGHKVTGDITNCYINSLSITGNNKVGGLVGSIEGESSTSHFTLKSNVAIANSISATVDNVGRIYGYKNNDYVTIGALASTEGNRALTTTKIIKKGVVQETTDDLQNGNVMGKSLLRLKANYVALGWNFDSNWDILETECYPYKKYQAAPPVIESTLVSQDTEISGSSLNGGTVYLYYKDREVVSTDCIGHAWTFSIDKLQSGAPVQLYADVEGMTPSYLTSSSVGYPGSGTEADPYRIYTAEDLQGASNKGYYKLMNDIDLSAWINENSPTKGWIAIGRNSGEATYINGDGHKVTGLWINTTEDYTGLFSNFSAGIIKNLTVEVASGKKVKGGDYTGILIGRNANGQLLNCTVKGDVEGTKHVGGVTGYSGNNTINAVTFEGKVMSTADNAYVGGFSGLSENDDITAVHSYATISSMGVSNYVGGAIGYLNGGTITKSHAENSLTATGTNDCVGGLVGHSKGEILLSYSTGAVTASGSDSYTGGLVGYAYNPIANCYSTAKTTGTYYTAGLCAYTYSTIDKCYSKGDVYGSRYGGGVVAQLDGVDAALTNSIAVNNKLELTDQAAWGSRVIGGFRNGAAEPDNSNYALSTMQVSLNGVAQKKTDDAVEGIAKTGAVLMSVDTYITLGWDYSTAWGIDEGQTYPYLLWEIDVNPVTEVTLDNSNLIIAQGNTATLIASVMPLGATNKRLEWKSSNKAVVTVADGIVSAVGIGTANITATSTDGSNITATCKVTVVANKDAAIAELQTLVGEAQALYDNSTEGENIGQYQAGARAALLTVIRSVKAKISSTMSDDEIASCTNDINNAVAAFKELQVKAGEDTDVTMYENVVFFEKAEAAAGQQITLSLMLNNTVAPTGFQCDLYLPDGVTVAKDEDDFNMIDLSTVRTTARKTDYFNSAKQADGCVRIMCSSTQNYTFSGADGEVALVTLNISSDIDEGDYPIVLKNIVISDAAANSYEVDYVKSTLAISSYTIGDANNDGKINVSDFSAIAGYIMGNPPVKFVEKAADVNADTKINVSDLTGVATIILYGSLNQPSKSRLRATNDAISALLVVNDYNVSVGSEFTIDVNINGNYTFSGYQFDMNLPEGIFLKKIDEMPCAELSYERTDSYSTDFFASGMTEERNLRVLAASTHDNCFSGTEGSVARITLMADENVGMGDYSISIDNIIISASGNGVELAPSVFKVHIGEATGIQNVNDSSDVLSDIYDLTGKIVKKAASISELNKGTYIINGKKVIK